MIPTPESGTPAAIGFARGVRHPVRPGAGQERLCRAAPSSSRRRPSGSSASGSSSTRCGTSSAASASSWSTTRSSAGNTQRALVRMLRESGALEVHVRIASPPVRWPCFYGIDFASRAELIANAGDVEAVRRSIGADTLGYVSMEALSPPPSSRGTGCAQRVSPATTRSRSRIRSASTCSRASPAESSTRRPLHGRAGDATRWFAARSTGTTRGVAGDAAPADRRTATAPQDALTRP